MGRSLSGLLGLLHLTSRLGLGEHLCQQMGHMRPTTTAHTLVNTPGRTSREEVSSLAQASDDGTEKDPRRRITPSTIGGHTQLLQTVTASAEPLPTMTVLAVISTSRVASARMAAAVSEAAAAVAADEAMPTDTSTRTDMWRPCRPLTRSQWGLARQLSSILNMALISRHHRGSTVVAAIARNRSLPISTGFRHFKLARPRLLCKRTACTTTARRP
jgi:hypothetical protein